MYDASFHRGGGSPSGRLLPAAASCQPCAARCRRRDPDATVRLPWSPPLAATVHRAASPCRTASPPSNPMPVRLPGGLSDHRGSLCSPLAVPLGNSPPFRSRSARNRGRRPSPSTAYPASLHPTGNDQPKADSILKCLEKRFSVFRGQLPKPLHNLEGVLGGHRLLAACLGFSLGRQSPEKPTSGQ